MDQKEKVCVQLFPCLLLPFSAAFTSNSLQSGGKLCFIYPLCCKADVHPAPDRNLSACPPEPRAPSCLPNAPAISLPPLSYSLFSCTENSQQAKGTKKSFPSLLFSEVPPPGKESPSFPRSSLVLYNGTNHRSGNKLKQVLSLMVRMRAWQRELLYLARGVNDVSPAAFLLSLPTLAGEVLPQVNTEMNS